MESSDDFYGTFISTVVPDRHSEVTHDSFSFFFFQSIMTELFKPQFVLIGFLIGWYRRTLVISSFDLFNKNCGGGFLVGSPTVKN